ncbi:hypothetical protein HALLA_02930 (plasmid) [Halostagnicola larsenii XH-48]|uniref:Uncharacterized protein n=1 Tax=Halostagnicola larsenii XH-48 TaxID=797299 RepID=W0JRZ1_9EURY|nr:hypothetical protein HALLA_02930 [Halostagnicola larsenii XH-48]
MRTESRRERDRETCLFGHSGGSRFDPGALAALETRD